MITAAALHATGAFPTFTDDDAEVFLGGVHERAFPAGALLWGFGTPPESCHVLLTGQIDVVRGLHPHERVLATARRGAMLGQLALLDRTPRSAGLRARTEARTLELSGSAFEALMRASSPMALRFRRQVAVHTVRQMREASRRLAVMVEGRDARPVARSAARPLPAASSPLPPVHTDDAHDFLRATAAGLGVSLESLEAVEVLSVERPPPREGWGR